ncbi:histidine kinase [Nonomuraea sp. NPDC046570]|uniref:histidine kinase n=1 Tax=Nonomuraea sp. NPDC046570 TaxID=3155255 RepID=UPI0033E65420
MEGTAAGTMMRERRLYAERLPAPAEERTRRQAAEERLRIARELHDAIGYSLSTIAVRAGVAGHVGEVGLTVYRIVQEALTDVLKHAGAGRVRVVGDGGGVEVTDGGRAAVPRAYGHGANVRTRVHLVICACEAGLLD